MKYLYKAVPLSFYLAVLLLISSLTIAQETAYLTPKYDNVYHANIKALTGGTDAEGLAYRELTFDKISKSFGNSDGFMVDYEPAKIHRNTNSLLLMGFYNGTQKLLEIFQSRETLTLRRYDTKGVHIDYLLFDKIIYLDNYFPKFKIYLSDYFIWIEQSEFHIVNRNSHSPIFWGLANGAATSNTSLFTSRSANAKLRLYHYYDNDGYTVEDIGIYAFNADTLNKELERYANGTYSSKIITAERQFNIYSAKSALTEEDLAKSNEAFQIYPNPATDELFISLPSNAENTKIELVDIQGRLIFEAETTENEYIIPIKELSISSGLFFVRSSNKNETNSKKVLIIN